MKTSTIEKSIEIEYSVSYVLEDDPTMEEHYTESESVLKETLIDFENIKEQYKGNLYSISIETRIINISNDNEIAKYQPNTYFHL